MQPFFIKKNSLYQNHCDDEASKGYRLHTITTSNGGSKGLMSGDRIQATMVFERIED